MISRGKIHFFIFSFIIIHTYALATSESIAFKNQQLIKDLQNGGHIIYMRHAKTNHNIKDKGLDRLKSCSMQRNLSEVGKKQAIKIGRAIELLQIPVGDVYSSPYCRCKETAQLAFGNFEIENDLQYSISKAKDESAFLGKRLFELMLSALTPSSNDNVVFVGHTSNLKDALNVWPEPEGVIVIFKKVNNKIKYKGMIAPSFLEALVDS